MLRKFALALFAILAAQNVFAGSLIVQVTGAGSSVGSELKYYTFENRAGVRYLYLQSKLDESCRVPVEMLKSLGIDPLQAANLLLNSKTAAPIIECQMTTTEAGRTRIATDVSFTSFPKP